jgi:hypothetical protein
LPSSSIAAAVDRSDMRLALYVESMRPAWEAFCRRCPEAWFWHTREWFEYAAALLGERMRADASFVMLDDNGELVAVAPAMVVGEAAGAQLALGDQPVPWPAISSPDDLRRVEAEAAIYRQYSRAAREHAAERITTFGVVPAQAFFRAEPHPPNRALAHGYTDESRTTHVINLTRDEETLWRDVRKGHRSAIRAGQRRLSLRTWCGAIQDEEFEAYKTLHALAAGRVTRNVATFDAMRGWIRSENGLLVGAKLDADWVGFAYFILFDKAAFYASACNHPVAVTSTPIGHALIWQAILACRSRGMELVEMGMQTPAAPDADPKLVSISLFKRGFGGYSLPRHLGVLDVVR